MKKLAVVLLSLALSAPALAAPQLPPQLKLAPDEAEEAVVFALTTGSVSVDAVADVFRAASPAARAALVEQSLAWIKAFVASPGFARRYATAREEAKPTPPEFSGSVEDEIKRRRAEQRAGVEEMRRALKDLPPAQRKELEAAMKDMLAQLAAQERDPDYRKMERQMIEEERRYAKEGYQEDLARWQQDYPADPSRLVAQRLREFLQETADVDYNARLVSQDGRQRFANPEYERKPRGWKLAFRAGREPVEKARAFAGNWLAELK